MKKRRVNELEGVNTLAHIRQRRKQGGHPPGRRSASVIFIYLIFVLFVLFSTLYFLARLGVPCSWENQGYWDCV
jgi:hypothetical protein